MDAMVDPWPLLSCTPKEIHSRLKVITHTSLKTPSAPMTSLRELLEPPPMLQLPKTAQTNSRLPLPRDQSLLPSRPIRPFSKLIPVVSLPLLSAEPPSITEFLLSDMELRMDKTTTLSRTLGDQTGVLMVTSRSELPLEPESAVSKCNQFSQPPTEHDLSL